MTELVSTKTTKFLTFNNTKNQSNSSLSIQTLADIDFNNWLNTLTSKQAQWVTDCGFTAAKNQTIKLFDDSGKITEIILGLGAESSVSGIAAYANIAKVYRLDDIKYQTILNRCYQVLVGLSLNMNLTTTRLKRIAIMQFLL